MLKLGYNTSGFSRSENLKYVVGVIRALGYSGMELTLDIKHFHPYFSNEQTMRQLARRISSHNLDLVLNTGGRYVLSDVAHEPSLVSASAAERERVVQFVADTIQIAPTLGAQIVMLHSGALPPQVDPAMAWNWLFAEVDYLANIAHGHCVKLGFEFHPSMFVADLADYRFLKSHVDSPALGLTLDVGHVVCSETRLVSQVIIECNGDIVNVHLEDIKGRKHTHLPIGHGDIDFVDVFRGLKAIDYRGLINAEFNTNDLEVDECQLALETFKYLRRLL